ncbi:ribonuclease H-like domain-containing protein [Tanacetum coccineum]
MTFPGIDKYTVFSIVSELVYGIIYKNNKKEKRVMRHQEVHKFCDATLKRVLEGLKSYNNNVKYGYVTHNLSKEDVEYLQLFAEEIEERLKYRDQMRRWEMLYSLDKYQFIFSKDVKFFEIVLPFKDSVTEKNDTLNVFQDINHVNVFDIEYPKIPYNDERVDPNMNSDKKSQSDSSHSSMPGENINTADFLNNYGNDVDSSEDIFVAHDEQLNKTSEPKSFYEASKFTHWNEAMNNEMDALLRNDTWDIVDLPKDGKAIGKGIDYEETFSPVVKMVTVRLKKSLYGLKQTPRQWNAKLTSALIENGFSQSKSDYSLYTKSDKDVFLALLVYVDDIIITAYNNDPILDNITDYQKLMGKLIYLTNTRPDISYVVHCLSQFMHSPLKSHLKIAFKILGYLKSYLGLGIQFSKNSVTLHCDSNSAIKIIANPVFHERTKHLEIYLHFVREKILKGVVKTVKVESANQIVDILTKGVDTAQHKELVKKLGMIGIYQGLAEFEYCRKLKD